MQGSHHQDFPDGGKGAAGMLTKNFIQGLLDSSESYDRCLVDIETDIHTAMIISLTIRTNFVLIVIRTLHVCTL